MFIIEFDEKLIAVDVTKPVKPWNPSLGNARRPYRPLEEKTWVRAYRCVGVCFSGFGGSVGEVWISGGSTGLHGLLAISVLMLRSLLHSASVASQS
jgi:hypothetical protein